jgi:hypothetical protein
MRAGSELVEERDETEVRVYQSETDLANGSYLCHPREQVKTEAFVQTCTISNASGLVPHYVIYPPKCMGVLTLLIFPVSPDLFNNVFENPEDSVLCRMTAKLINYKEQRMSWHILI